MHQLHWMSGIKGSGFSHPPPLLALKEHSAHSASRGEGSRAAKANVSEILAEVPLLGMTVSASTPPLSMVGSTSPREDVCNLISAAHL